MKLQAFVFHLIWRSSCFDSFFDKLIDFRRTLLFRFSCECRAAHATHASGARLLSWYVPIPPFQCCICGFSHRKHPVPYLILLISHVGCTYTTSVPGVHFYRLRGGVEKILLRRGGGCLKGTWVASVRLTLLISFLHTLPFRFFPPRTPLSYYPLLHVPLIFL